jgi:hypothetical protein
MIHIEMTAQEGHITLRFDVPDKPDEKLRLDELATFAVHLDLVKHRIVELLNKAIATGDGYDIDVSESSPAISESRQSGLGKPLPNKTRARGFTHR